MVLFLERIEIVKVFLCAIVQREKSFCYNAFIIFWANLCKPSDDLRVNLYESLFTICSSTNCYSKIEVISESQIIIWAIAVRDNVLSNIWIITLIEVNELYCTIWKCQAQNHYRQKATNKGVYLSIASYVKIRHFLAKVILFSNTVRSMPSILDIGMFAAVTAISNMRHILAQIFLVNFSFKLNKN